MCENLNPNPRPWDNPDIRPSIKYHNNHTSWDNKTCNIIPVTDYDLVNTITITPQHARTITLTLDHGMSLTPDNE